MTLQQASATMARVATNVAVLSIVTSANAYGVTANVWGEEANAGWLLVTLRREGRFLPAVLDQGRFVASLLGEAQQDTALRFAQHAGQSQPGVASPELAPAGPGARLRSCHAWFVCSVAATAPFGSYEIVTAEITESGTGDQPRPLLYHDGSFGRLAGGTP